MKKSHAFLLFLLMLSGCGGEPPYDESHHANISETDKDRQMVAALKSVSLSYDVTKHRHFHVLDLKEERQRMIHNLQGVISDYRVETISIGCDSKETCYEVVRAALRSASLEEVGRDDLLIFLPDFLTLESMPDIEPEYKFSIYAIP